MNARAAGRVSVAVLCGAVLATPGGTGVAVAAEPPSVVTTGWAPGDLTIDGADTTIQGLVRPNGSDTVVWFEWGLTSDYGSTTPQRTIPADGAGWPVLKEGDVLDGARLFLLPGELYHYRLVGSNAGGTAYGDDVTMRGRSVQLSTRPATKVTAGTATLNAWLDEKGWTTSYHFEYGTTTAYGSSTPAQELPAREPWSFTTIVALPVTGLLPATMYHFRVVVDTPRGPVVGNDVDLVTLSAPPSADVPATSSPTQPTTAGVALPKQRLRSALKRGFRSTVTCPRACRVQSVLFRSRGSHRRLGAACRTVLARGSVGSQAGGTVAVTARFVREAKRELARSKSVGVMVRTTITDASGTTRATRSFVTLER